jgi:branched-chain amino acid aminotransferase
MTAAATTTTPQSNLHDASIDPRNRSILISVNGDLVPREEAKVSVFDSGFVLGDGVWEGMRIVNGGVPFLRAHLERLYEGAKGIFMDIGLAPDALVQRLFACIDANGMTDGAHVRLMVTRGIKSTPYQDPRVTIGKPTIVIIPEYKLPRPDSMDQGLKLYKSPRPDAMTQGLRLHTVNVRRGPPDAQDPKLNSHSKLNCITACIQAANAGADEALMLDPHGFVATCNSTHFFIVRRGEVWTSTGQYCIAGITRGTVVRLGRELGIPVFEKSFSLLDVYGADEAFVTGTFAGLTPVREVDGRAVRHPLSSEPWRGAGPMCRRLSDAYKALALRESTRSL